LVACVVLPPVDPRGLAAKLFGRENVACCNEVAFWQALANVTVALSGGGLVVSAGGVADPTTIFKDGSETIRARGTLGAKSPAASRWRIDRASGPPLALKGLALAASAVTECVIVRIAKADITRVIHKEPAFAELFIAHLLARNSRVEEDLVDQLFNSSEKRLARMLLLLANFGKEGRPEPIIAKISQETLAEMIGTTRSRVSFFMNKFRELGLIDYNGHIEVHSSLLNVVLRDQPQIKS
jgi:CRP/FNR family transcriptional regulator, cyclic AMP receptor protein